MGREYYYPIATRNSEPVRQSSSEASTPAYMGMLGSKAPERASSFRQAQMLGRVGRHGVAYGLHLAPVLLRLKVAGQRYHGLVMPRTATVPSVTPC